MTPFPALPGFRILRRLGRGGMGEVFHAERLGPGGFRKQVALKRLAVDHALDTRQVQRFFREARISAQLEHPNIVEVHDLLAIEAGYFIVMELLRGVTWLRLVGHLRSAGALPWWLPLAIADQALAALDHAHAMRDEDGRRLGLVHRDLTPRNLFVCTDGTVKLLDFGLARVLEGMTGRLTADGQLAGTLEYLSPEQARGEEVDARSDLHQLGACLYQAYAGAPPHAGGTPSEVLARVLIGGAAPLGERRPDLPPLVCAVVDQALAGDRAHRFADAAAMRAAVRAALAAAPAVGGALAAAVAQVPLEGEDSEPVTGTLLPAGEEPGTADLRPIEAVPAAPVRRRWRVPILVAALAASGAAGFFLGRDDARPARVTRAEATTWQRLTFRRGLIRQARFAGDGTTFAYSAAWGEETLDTFLGAPGDPVPNARGVAGGELLAVSPRRELALLVDAQGGGVARRGVLARAPLDAGAPQRQPIEDVQWADYGPEGELAVVRWTGDGARLEYPPGTVLLEVRGGWLGAPRVSRTGAIAVVRHPSTGLRGWVELIERGSSPRRLGPEWTSIDGLAWRADGEEIWFTAASGGEGRQLHAVEPGGEVRRLAEAPGNLTLQDVSARGALVRRDEVDSQVWAGRRDGSLRDLSWLESSAVHDISRDGRLLLLGDGARVLVRGGDGAPPVAIAEGIPAGLVEDGTRALVIAPDRNSLSLVPTAGGQSVSMTVDELRPIASAAIAPDGDAILVGVGRPGEPERVHLIDVDSRAHRPVGRPGLALPAGGNPISTDGRQVALVDTATGLLQLVSLDTGSAEPEVRPAPGGQAGEGFARFRTRRALYVARLGGTRIEVGRIDLDVRTRELWREIRPPDPSGVIEISSFALGSLSDSYAFTCRRQLSTLYLVDRL